MAAGADELPTVAVPATAGATDGPMVLLLTGDGDWVSFMRTLADALAAHGAPVLVVKMRAYLSEPRTPEQTADAFATAVRGRLEQWERRDLVVVGYSRGADAAPFVVSRWPEDLRTRVRALVLIGLSERASFEFHFEDLIRDVARPTDLPTRPEVEKLVGIPISCIRGASEEDSFCDRPTPGMRTVIHNGPHRAQADDGTVELVLGELHLDR
jgi:type IV secretory pathway VirJ component